MGTPFWSFSSAQALRSGDAADSSKRGLSSQPWGGDATSRRWEHKGRLKGVQASQFLPAPSAASPTWQVPTRPASFVHLAPQALS